MESEPKPYRPQSDDEREASAEEAKRDQNEILRKFGPDPDDKTPEDMDE